jgi:hypothetical protein
MYFTGVSCFLQNPLLQEQECSSVVERRCSSEMARECSTLQKRRCSTEWVKECGQSTCDTAQVAWLSLLPLCLLCTIYLIIFLVGSTLLFFLSITISSSILTFPLNFSLYLSFYHCPTCRFSSIPRHFLCLMLFSCAGCGLLGGTARSLHHCHGQGNRLRFFKVYLPQHAGSHYRWNPVNMLKIRWQNIGNYIRGAPLKR